MSILTQTQRVLTRVDLPDDGILAITFCEYDLDKPLEELLAIDIPPHVYRDMGEPEQITVTIQVGDALNS